MSLIFVDYFFFRFSFCYCIGIPSTALQLHIINIKNNIFLFILHMGSSSTSFLYHTLYNHFFKPPYTLTLAEILCAFKVCFCAFYGNSSSVLQCIYCALPSNWRLCYLILYIHPYIGSMTNTRVIRYTSGIGGIDHTQSLHFLGIFP